MREVRHFLFLFVAASYLVEKERKEDIRKREKQRESEKLVETEVMGGQE